MNLSLFSTKPNETGFRLHTYEVWNWGTFDHQIWTMEPGGETSLLTGANASGKTTLVDGLLTLLVPEKRMRFYNQTAGAKGERTEDSYVMGEYGETENELTNTREIKKLRTDKVKAQSILLAVFQNESQYITLIQARWYAGGELKRAFILAYKQLSINADLMPFDSNGDWKKRLKQKYPKQGAKEILCFMDSPGDYGRLMRKVLGMRSEKAHTLFSQTIGLKVLGNLDEFVRLQMLEERDAEAEFQKIKAYFKTLSDAHRAIEKTNKQIELLSPIRDKGTILAKHKADLMLQENHHQIAPLWFARKSQLLIEVFIADQMILKTTAETKINSLKVEIDELDGKRIAIAVQIESDEVGRQIGDIEKENKRITREKEDKEAALKYYNQLAGQLDFQLNPQSSGLFDEQRNLAKERKISANTELSKLDDDLYQAKRSEETLKEQFENVSNELNILRSQKNNITGSPARIRNELLEFTGASESEIPFVAELIKIKGDARDWESAIERVLHNFALRLIVPDEYYQQVNQYVNQHDLKGRIIYQRFNKRDVSTRIFQQTNEDELIHKLEFKPSIYTEWIKNEIAGKFNYICTDDMELFRLSDKALTSAGLTKSAARHEKDDRPEVKNRQQYVLGWDNKEKLTILKEDAVELNLKITEAGKRITYVKNHQSRIRKDEEALTRFVEHDAFKKIDWWSLSAQIQQNKGKIEELEKTNDRVNTLKKQRDQLIETLSQLSKDSDLMKASLNNIESGINQQRQKLRETIDTISRYPDMGIADNLLLFEKEFVSETELDVDGIDHIKSKIQRKINDAITNYKDQIRIEESAVETLMRSFINPERSISDQFEDWNSDTHRLRESAAFIDEYIALLDRLEKQELAGYKHQFKKYLNEEMITKMSDFQTWLERQEEDIEENIETLNKSLAKIDFKSNPPTFIRLHVEKDYAVRVKDFKIRLNDWKPNLIEFERTKDDDILEQSFNKIKALLDYLTTDEHARKEVLDVRNWLKFKAVEHHKEDPTKIFRSYTGTAKLSGGEGAQLTYTILGSAIAYQFGIHQEGMNTNSFRFICVDEAFSKQDDEKAKFLMELCKQLHLQVMVVSPAKAEEVAIVEPYIARVHFVQRKDNRHSVVYDMPIRQLKEHREQYLQASD
ncbi:hypothetical protein HQ865_25035 [Mucilaginibacter mali]|uniref:Uncharacterized protein n=2 Tax=Mucilaginibacter mali TaxID=2740462 RepID=A0A7D4UQG3_9SPHI|nr:hypothetical protein HQ865_25035 [Mucilaginibacter mali]